MPWIENTEDHGQLDAMSGPRYLKTHNSYDFVAFDPAVRCKYIYIARCVETDIRISVSGLCIFSIHILASAYLSHCISLPYQSLPVYYTTISLLSILSSLVPGTQKTSVSPLTLIVLGTQPPSLPYPTNRSRNLLTPSRR